jgi:hypothetical protein
MANGAARKKGAVTNAGKVPMKFRRVILGIHFLGKEVYSDLRQDKISISTLPCAES